MGVQLDKFHQSIKVNLLLDGSDCSKPYDVEGLAANSDVSYISLTQTAQRYRSDKSAPDPFFFF